MMKKIFISKFNSIDNKLNQYPLTFNDNIKLKNGKNSSNFTKNILKKRHSQTKLSFIPSKNKLNFNQSFFGNKQKKKKKKIKLLNADKKENLESKLRRINSIKMKENKKIRHLSQLQSNQSELLYQEFNERLLNKGLGQIPHNEKEKEETENDDLEEMDIDVNQLIEKINKEFSDIGKLIRMNFIVNNEKKFTFDKNEHVILKIIANDLNENQGIVVKEFFCNNQKLNMFKSIKDNKIKNNSIIKVII